MYSTIIAIIVTGGAILFLIILGIISIAIIRIFKTGELSKHEKTGRAEEARMIQDIYNTLPKIEQRVEALETILIERGHPDH